MIDIPRLPQPPAGKDFPEAAGFGWWWGELATDPPVPLLYLRTPTGALACLRLHAIAADGTVTPSILVSVGDGKGDFREDWHVHGRLLGWTADDTLKYGRPA